MAERADLDSVLRLVFGIVGLAFDVSSRSELDVYIFHIFLSFG
jgi:hypothetical protein